MAIQKTIGEMSTYSYREIPTTLVDQNNDYPLAKAMAIRMQASTNKLKNYMVDRTISSLSDTQKNNYLEIPDDSVVNWINRTINFTGNDTVTVPCNLTNITQASPAANLLNAGYYPTSIESGRKAGFAVGFDIQPCNEEAVYYTRVRQYQFNNNYLTDRSVYAYTPEDNTGTPTDPNIFYYNTIEKIKGALASGDFYYIKNFKFVNWNGSVATDTTAADTFAYRNAALWFESDMNVPRVTADAYDGNIERLQGAIIANRLFTWFRFSTAVLGDLFNPGLLKGVIKPDEFLGWRGGNDYGAIIKKEALIRFMNLTGIPFLIKEGAISLSDFTPDYSEWGGYDPNYEYEDPDGPPRGQNENTTSDWTGKGDNTEDSLSLQKPNMSPFAEAVNQYTLNAFDLYHFTRSMYTDTFIDDWERLNSDPREGLVSCKFYPFDVKAHDAYNTASREEIVIGNVQMNGIQANRILTGYNQILDIGEFDIREYFGGFLDYQLTAIDIYLPYIGWQQLQATSVMNRKLKIKYIVDIITGECTCLLTSTDGKVERLENTFNGVMGVDVPILVSNHNENMKQTASSILSGVVAVGGAVASFATGGVAAPIAIGAGVASVANTATNIATMQNHVKMGTPAGASTSMWMPQDIIFRITRPTKSEATEFKNRHGYRANFSTKLSDTSGYCQVDSPRLDIIATDREKEELKSLLQGGIYL